MIYDVDGFVTGNGRVLADVEVVFEVEYTDPVAANNAVAIIDLATDNPEELLTLIQVQLVTVLSLSLSLSSASLTV